MCITINNLCLVNHQLMVIQGQLLLIAKMHQLRKRSTYRILYDSNVTKLILSYYVPLIEWLRTLKDRKNTDRENRILGLLVHLPFSTESDHQISVEIWTHYQFWHTRISYLYCRNFNFNSTENSNEYPELPDRIIFDPDEYVNLEIDGININTSNFAYTFWPTCTIKYHLCRHLNDEHLYWINEDKKTAFDKRINLFEVIEYIDTFLEIPF